MTVRVQPGLLSVFVLLLFSMVACQAQAAEAPEPVGEASTPVGEASTPASEPSAVQPDQPEATAIPGTSPASLPANRLDHGGDVDSAATASKKLVTSGDVFIQGLYERPFNANTMDKYFPYVDIVDIQGFKDETWGYATITLSGTDADGHLPGQYAVEIDLNRDGRGDWLIRATSVNSTDWGRQGVQAWKDSNPDLGGAVALRADNSPTAGDGYETLVFDQGNGSLTDAAWVRISPSDPKTVEMAFKLEMIGSPTSYAMGAWAATNLDVALFDHNDHMTHAQAGSPSPGYDVYPLKDLAEIDNTCRLAIGFQPTGMEPGLCATIEQKIREEQNVAPEPPPQQPPGRQPPD